MAQFTHLHSVARTYWQESPHAFCYVNLPNCLLLQFLKIWMYLGYFFRNLPRLPIPYRNTSSILGFSVQFSSITQLCWLFVIPWTAACQASLSITNSWSLLKLMSIELVMPSNQLILCLPLLLLPSIFPSIMVFSKESVHQVAKVLEFQLPHQSFQWIFRTDFLQNGLVGSPCSPRDSQKSSPTPQFKNIISSVLSFLYGPTLISI